MFRGPGVIKSERVSKGAETATGAVATKRAVAAGGQGAATTALESVAAAGVLKTGTVWTGSGWSLGLGLGLGAWGPALLGATIICTAYYLYRGSKEAPVKSVEKEGEA